LAAAALVGAAPVVMAQGQQLFQWTGRVDREVQIVMRGDQLSTRRIGATEPNWAQGRAMSDLPRQDGIGADLDAARLQAPQRPILALAPGQHPSGQPDPVPAARRRQDADVEQAVVEPGRGQQGEPAGISGQQRWLRRPAVTPLRRSAVTERLRQPHDAAWSGNVDDQVEVRIQKAESFRAR
jgi:hypothetical protein